MPFIIPHVMRACIAGAYGGPEVLTFATIPTPVPGPRELLVRVEATTVSSADRRIRALDVPFGLKTICRLVFGLFRPRKGMLGVEFTGQVVATGPKATRFAPGDHIIAFSGTRLGGHAEYALVKDDGAVIRRPAGMTVETAAALSFGGSTARYFLRCAEIKPKERVLVIGASGTVGSALMQLATAAGADVTAVVSTPNVALARSLGARRVIDYTQNDYLSEGALYDIIADAVGALTFRKAEPIMAENGRYLAINAGVRDMLTRRRGPRRCIAGPAPETASDLQALADMVMAGDFTPLIDSVRGFDDIPAAHAHADTGRKRGTIVIRL